MDTFPRVGNELSARACVSYGKPAVSGKPTYERPGLIVEFENGWEELRALGDGGRYKTIPVAFLVNQTDFDTIFTFLKNHDLFVQQFILEHPYLGTGNVNYAGCDGGPRTEFSPDIVVAGNPTWYAFEIVFRGAF